MEVDRRVAGISSILFLFSQPLGLSPAAPQGHQSPVCGSLIEGISLLFGGMVETRAQMGGNCGKRWEPEGEGYPWQRGDLGRALL